MLKNNKNKKIEYYSLDNILKYDVHYYIIYGERSNGKSYAVDKYVLDKYFTTGEQFVICKRYAEDMTSTICSTMLVPLYEYVLETYGYYIRFYQSKWYATKDKDIPITQQEVIGYAQALNTVERHKGSQYPKVTTIIFEEFMSIKGSYLPDEIKLLLNLVSTIARKRNNVKIFMLGNTISKYSPYSEALGIKLDKLKFNEIVVKKFKVGKATTKFAIERSRHVEVFDNGDSYTNFGKVSSSMINEGAFESSNYNMWNDGICFRDNRKEYIKEFNCIPMLIDKSKENNTNIYLEYQDEYYNIFIKNKTVGFKKCLAMTEPPTRALAIINGKKVYKNNAVSIKNIRYFKGTPYLSNYLNIIVQAFFNDDMIFINNEDGEDIMTALSLCGLRK